MKPQDAENADTRRDAESMADVVGWRYSSVLCGAASFAVHGFSTARKTMRTVMTPVSARRLIAIAVIVLGARNAPRRSRGSRARFPPRSLPRAEQR